MKNLDLWEYGVPDEYELEEINEENIFKVQKELGFQLPSSYLELLKKKNGGRFRIPFLLENIFPTYEELPDDEGALQLEYFLGLSPNFHEGILKTFAISQEWELPANLVLFTGDGHWWLALDYRHYQGDNPPIAYLDSEYEMDKQVAKDFSDLLEKLKPDESFDNEYEYVEPLLTLTEIEKALKKKDIYTFTDGYRQMAKQGNDINWLLEKLDFFAHNSDFSSVFSCEYYLTERLKIAKKEDFNYKKAENLVDKLLHYPTEKYYDEDEIVLRGARRLQSVLKLLK